jgi:ABC-type transport system involved in multi-copper enzyme maturation permease subunit
METPTAIPKKKNPIQNFFQRLLDNPVILKELRGRMRGRQAFILLTVYIGLIAIFIFMVYNLLFSISSGAQWDPSTRQTAGKAIFGTVVLLELLLLSFIAPGLTAGSITSERERQTFDLLRTTLLSARSFVFGKLGSSFSFLFLLILTGVPVQSLAFILGGVGLGEMIVSGLMLVVTAIFYCTLGIFFSSLMRRTLAATISSYAAILLSFLLIGVMFFLIAYIESISYSSPTPPSKTSQYILIGILWFLISTNPLVAAVMSEVILVDQQSLFFTNSSVFGSNGPSTMISPWIIYVGFYSVLTLILIALSIYFVKRPDR